METIEKLLKEILEQLKKTLNVSVVNTSVNGNDCTFTVYQTFPCSDDIYCIFVNPQTQALYALQNIGAWFWVKWSNGLQPDEYMVIPATNHLIRNRENCLGEFVGWRRKQELDEIPIVLESFNNPF